MSISITNAQCKNEKDPITGEKLIQYDFSKKAIYFDYKNDTIHFELRMNYPGTVKVAFEKGAKLYLKLKNDEVIELTSYAPSYPRSQASQHGVYSGFQFRFVISKETLEKMANEKVDLIRYPDPNGGHLDIKPKRNRRKLMKGAECILSNM